MKNFYFKSHPSYIFFTLAGLFLVLSLPTLSMENLDLWLTAKGFYVFGAVLFLFNK